LKGDERNAAVEQRDDVEEATSYILGNEDSAVLILGVALPLDVPVLDCSYNVGFVGRSQLNFDFVTPFLGVLEQQIEPSGPWLNPLFVPQN
jgi:hypothetical protein